jgi:hypothetical protein
MNAADILAVSGNGLALVPQQAAPQDTGRLAVSDRGFLPDPPCRPHTLPMPREYLARLIVNRKSYVIHQDSACIHPPAVHAALGTRSEEELQQYLQDCDPREYYDVNGQHLGADESGLELRWAT